MDFRQVSECLDAGLMARLSGYEERCQALVEAGKNKAADIGDRIKIAGPAENKAAGRTDCPVNLQRASAAPRPSLTPCGASAHEISLARRQARDYLRVNLVVVEGGRAATTANKGPAPGRAARLRLVMLDGERVHASTRPI